MFYGPPRITGARSVVITAQYRISQ